MQNGPRVGDGATTDGRSRAPRLDCRGRSSQDPGRRLPVRQAADRALRPLTELHSEEEVRDTILHEIAQCPRRPRARPRPRVARQGASDRVLGDGASPSTRHGWSATGSAPARPDTPRRDTEPPAVATCSRCSSLRPTQPHPLALSGRLGAPCPSGMPRVATVARHLRRHGGRGAPDAPSRSGTSSRWSRPRRPGTGPSARSSSSALREASGPIRGR